VRVLVTGGAGFIGSHIVDALVAAGHRVRVLDNLSPAAHSVRPDYLHPQAELLVADLADEVAVRRAVQDVDAVCHQAARVGLGVDFDDVSDYVRDNCLGTAVLLRALFARGFSGRLVLASSMVVYGEGGYRCADHGSVRPGPRLEADLRAGRFEPRCPQCGADLQPVDIDETAPVDPRNTYAATKVHQEHLCTGFARESGAILVSLRYHNVYGPRMPRDTPYAGVASIIRSALSRGVAPRIFEDGRQRRDFVHVRDVARANVLALTASDPAPGTYNVASGRPATLWQMATSLHAAYPQGTPAPVLTGDYRLGDVRHVTASARRAADRLGFLAGVGLDEGMAAFATDPMRAGSPA
jgi:dTDP-L-rhamnose 4-epimerase